MTENKDIFNLLFKCMGGLENPSFFEDLFSCEEECPYGQAVYSTIEHNVIIYREEIVQQDIPDDVHFRLHQVIKEQWISYKDPDQTDPEEDL